MASSPPIIYYDLGSPYAYLAVERAERVLQATARLQPVLVGGILRRTWPRQLGAHERAGGAHRRGQCPSGAVRDRGHGLAGGLAEQHAEGDAGGGLGRSAREWPLLRPGRIQACLSRGGGFESVGRADRHRRCGGSTGPTTTGGHRGSGDQGCPANGNRPRLDPRRRRSALQQRRSCSQPGGEAGNSVI